MEDVKIIPLGGLGEVGMNCMVYEWKDEAIMVDCGVMFHDEDIGVDIIHPDFSYILERAHKLKAIILTHGHEDHIGALPFLLQSVNVPIYATEYTLTLIKEKFKEIPIPWRINEKKINADSKLDIGPFKIEFSSVNHSIPQSLSIFIQTPVGNLLHTSDFKIGHPSDKDKFDEDRFGEFAARGVDLLLSDSTNIERQGRCGAESSVTEAIEAIVNESKAAVFITFFPSNIRRAEALIDMAQRGGKEVFILGRSMEKYLKAGESSGLINLNDFRVVFTGGGGNLHYNRQSATFLVSGTQGEEKSAMTKISAGHYRGIKVQKADTVIFSARHIPGNEMAISRVMDGLARQGAKIFHVDNHPQVHVSGHAYRNELEHIIKITKPKFFIPIHGNYHYLTQHASAAKQIGINDVMVLENGKCGFFSKNSIRPGYRVKSGKVYIDGTIEVGETILNERRTISDGGVVTIVVCIDERKRSVLKPVKINYAGVLDVEKFSSVLEYVEEIVATTLSQLYTRGQINSYNIKKELRREAEKFFSRFFKRHPLVVVEVVNVKIRENV